MARILITAAGTASAYFFCKELRRLLGDAIEIYVSDVNEEKLIPAALIADVYLRVPPVADPNYHDIMISILRVNAIDFVVPLIDLDLMQLAADDEALIALGVRSTAPDLSVAEVLSDKVRMGVELAKINVPVPASYQLSDVDPSCDYFVKPRLGFGSRGAARVKGKDLLERETGDIVIQEICEGPEITVEVFCNKGELRVICRERIEVKAGVCTKARVFYDDVLFQHIRLIAADFKLPVASCFQFMRNQRGERCLTDANLRIGAGSALCAAIGWNLPLAAMMVWLGRADEALAFLQFDGSERYVVRVFEEVVTV